MEKHLRHFHGNSKNFSDLPKDDIPLKRLIEKGPEALSNVELLAILIGKKFNYKGKEVTPIEVSKKVLEKYSLKELSKASINELRQIFGIGLIRAAHIQVVFELARRWASYVNINRIEVRSPRDVFNILYPQMRDLEQEVLKVILLDSRNRLIKIEEVSKGGLNVSYVEPREIFRAAIKNNAAYIILVHNHPSGDAEPSLEDISFTREIVNLGEKLGIKVLDHIIIGDGCFKIVKI